jgi:hypothetical protein
VPELHDHAINGSLWSLQIEVRLYLMIGIGFLIGVFSSKRVFNALFFTVIILGYFAPDMFSRLFEPENHRHVAMMFMIGSFAWVNRESIPMRPDVMFALLVFAASLHGTSKFGFAYALLLPYLVFYIAIGKWGLWFNRWGDYSYGTYLAGLPATDAMSFPDIGNVGNTIFHVLAVFLAFLSWHLV